MPRKTNVKQKQNTQSSNKEPSLPSELRSKIMNFKELFPQYKQTSNDDIIAIFEEFNDDFDAAVYGTMNGLVTTKPSEKWQAVGQKKKKKSNTRDKSWGPSSQISRGQQSKKSTFKSNESFDNKNRRGSSTTRGHSSNKSSDKSDNSYRGRHSSRGNQSSRGNKGKQVTHTKKKEVTPSPPPIASSVTSSKPTPSLQTNQQTSVPISTQNSQSSTSFVTTKLSYANVAKSRQAWNPNNRSKPEIEEKKEISPPVNNNKKENITIKQEQDKEKEKEKENDIKQISNQNSTSTSPSSNVNSQNTTPSSQQFSNSQEVTNNPPTQTSSSQEKQQVDNNSTTKVERPRVGVLLPGNFTVDDNVSFQFGKLGMLDDDLVASAPNTTSSDSELQKTSSNSQNQSNTSSIQQNKQQVDTQNTISTQQTKIDDNNKDSEMQNVNTAIMGNFPQYPMYPGMESSEHGRVPMPFYPDNSFQPHGYTRDGKFQRTNAQNYPNGRDNSPKFNTGGVDNNTTGNTTNPPTSPNTGGTAQPFPFGYPMYPYMNQFHGGSYGNQFYHYPPYKGFPGYSQTFAGNNAPMSYGPNDDEFKQRMPNQLYPQNQDSSMIRDNKTAQGTQSSVQGNSQGNNTPNSQTGQTTNKQQNVQGKNNQLEGNYQTNDVSNNNFKQTPDQNDYYSNDYPNAFMNAHYYPNMVMGGYNASPIPQSSNQNPSSTQNPSHNNY